MKCINPCLLYDGHHEHQVLSTLHDPYHQDLNGKVSIFGRCRKLQRFF